MQPALDKPVVLVVDDSLETLHMLNDALEEASFKTLVALEGAQALTITQNIRPDIILLDALMPVMDGFETCKMLRQNTALADVPIIFMTGLSDAEHVVKGLTAGGVDYVTKPINPLELVARMRVHLANARITHSARQALDSAGQYLLTLTLAGQLVWATPQVYLRLMQAGALDDSVALQAPLQAELKQWLARKPSAGQSVMLRCGGQPVKVELLNLIDGKEYLLRLAEATTEASAVQRLKQVFGVTEREADVLVWLAKGKTNWEIGQILSVSPRTVNKHLEQIYKKLSVDNRTAAASQVLQCLGRS